MFQSHASCPNRAGLFYRASLFSAEPGLIGRRLLAATATAALVAAIVTMPDPGARPLVADLPVQNTIILHAPTPAALSAQVEAMRADLLARPGVGAVRVTGLRQQALSVAYSPRRLASLGITPADLEAAVADNAVGSRPGRIALRTDDMQAVANTPVQAGARVFRLGDVAQVLRAPSAPIATLHVNGEPAASLTITPTRQP